MLNDRILVSGKKRNGGKFRPTDWIDRLASCFAVYSSDRRLGWHAAIHPVYVKNEKCLAIDPGLALSHPEIWNHVFGFVQANELQILGNDQHPSNDDQSMKPSRAA